MEVDDPPAADPRPGTPHLFESSEPPSDPATPTPFPRSSLKRRAVSPPSKPPAMAPAAFPASTCALSVRQQVSAAADDQLLFLSDWKLATTSLAEALDSVISSLQGRPRELASALATKFISLARRDVPQQGPPGPPPLPEPTAPTAPQRAPQIPQAQSWASIATPVPGQEAWQTTAPNQRDPTRQRQRQTKESDSRIFLRLPSSSSLRGIGPHGVRVTLACKVPGEITRVQTVPTGYALSATEEGTTFLLSAQAKQLAGDGYFEAATEYHQVVVSRIPQRIWTPDNGWMPTTVSDISVEAERITGQKPLTTKLSNHQIEADSVTAVIAFPKKLRYALQLFGASGLSRPTRPKQRPLQCTRCHSFHDTRACRSSERCVSCGSSKPEHTCRAQCINCHGPHAADYPKCPARPYTQKGAIVRLSKAALTAANVGRGGPAHDLLLSYEADVILVQEPWTDMTRQLTKTHPRYQLFGPTTRWGARPRALTYVRRDLPAFPLPHPDSPDIAAVCISGLTIINTYRPPKDLVVPNTSSSTPSTLHTLLQYSPPQNTILAGDFNTHHPLWQPETEAHNTTPGATALIGWLEANGLALCIEPGTPTRGPNTIDLVFSDIPVEATAEDHLSSTSDHATILITVDWQEPPPRRKLGSTDWEKAKALLNLPHKDLPVDDIAEKLVNTVQEAIRGASKYNTRGLPRTPWWTSELTDLLRQTRQQQAPDYLPLRRAVSRAKASHWKERIEHATSPTDAFTLARLHRRADQLSAPPLHIRNNRVTTPQARRTPSSLPLLEKGTSLPHQQEEGPPTRPRDPILTHRVERAFQQKVASLLLLDVKGAFDAVDHQRLLSHLRLQGWDEGLTSWIHDWLSDRSVSVQVGDATATAKIRGGLPQGSPLSPVLFLLYAAQIVSSQDNSFCYADDLGLLFVGDSLEETSQQLVEVYKTITLSGAASGLPFSLEKTEIQHFSKQRKLSAPTVTLPGVGEIKPSPYTRWLGVLLDSKLTCRPHINWVFSRGKQLALHLRKLSNTQRGCPVASMRAAVIQCVIPTALYGAEVFYTGRGQKGLIDSLRSLLRLAALAILPAYRTTPTSALLREADLPYPEALLDGRELPSMHTILKGRDSPESSNASQRRHRREHV
ncbi:hypothetical protein N7522_011892 [Penicillium canescens]|nr:hypothetical protein N7522_011892 [Penicillium canescens]